MGKNNIFMNNHLSRFPLFHSFFPSPSLSLSLLSLLSLNHQYEREIVTSIGLLPNSGRYIDLSILQNAKERERDRKTDRKKGREGVCHKKHHSNTHILRFLIIFLFVSHSISSIPFPSLSLSE